MDEEKERYGRKMWAIATNVARKQEREKMRSERKRLKRQIRKLEANNKYRGRKKWDWKYRVFSVQTVVTIATSLVTMAAIELLMTKLGQ